MGREGDFYEMQSLQSELERLRQWVADLHSGMYVNCVYCGHRYGPKEDTPVAMADVLKEHISKCPEHPLAKALAEVKQLREEAVVHRNVAKRDERKLRQWEQRLLEMQEAAIDLSGQLDEAREAARDLFHPIKSPLVRKVKLEKHPWLEDE